MMAKLPLHTLHETKNAKFVYYGGFTLPQEFVGLVKEHQAVRQAAGLFDISHMVRFLLTGKDVIPFVDSLISNSIQNIPENKAVYALMLNEKGFPIDDLIAYVLSPQKVLLVMNAINSVIDESWIYEQIKNQKARVKLENITLSMVQFALQGPLSESILQSVITKKVELSELTFMTYRETKHQGKPLLISRSGYTGSDGFELYGDVDMMANLWESLAAIKDVTLCGLGARDTLRFEASLPLYSHEISESISPFESGLKFAIKMHKEFIGKEALLHQLEQPLLRQLVGIELLEKGVVRAEYPVLINEKIIGHITTGYWLPGHEKGLALALIQSPHATLGQDVTVMMRNTPLKARVRDMMFITKQYKR
jgi:aminomethyltransferase